MDRIPASGGIPEVVRAAGSPSAVAVAGIGVALGLIAHLPIVVALAVGGACWVAVVGLIAGRARRRRRRAETPAAIDPYAVPEPWRNFVQEALTAERRFGEAVARCQPGPLQDRLGEVRARISDGVGECWRAAHIGASLSAMLAGLDPSETGRRLLEVQRQRGPTGAGARSDEAIDEAEAALAARLQTARRLERVVQRTTDRLRVLTAQLNDAVAEAMALSLAAGDPTVAQLMAGSVDSAVSEIESLRQAMEETAGTPATGTPTKT
jgi:hypothetical protein